MDREIRYGRGHGLAHRGTADRGGLTACIGSHWLIRWRTNPRASAFDRAIAWNRAVGWIIPMMKSRPTGHPDRVYLPVRRRDPARVRP